MNRRLLGSMVALVVVAQAGACVITTEDGEGGSPPALTVAPAPLDGLTCEAYDFTLSGAAGTPVWSIDPNDSKLGAIDAQGHYTAPITVPESAFDVVGTIGASSGRARVTLHTANPKRVSTAGIAAKSIETNAIASSGKRVYTASMLGADQVQVNRSEDGGVTWTAPKKINDTPAGIVLGCVSVAVDAGNPDVVYVTYQATQNGGPYDKTSTLDDTHAGATIALAVSEDKGETWTNYVLESQNNEGFCASIVSGAADSVSVEIPTDDGVTETGDSIHMYTYVDGARGKGFATGVLDMNGYAADGRFSPFVLAPITYVSSNGGDDGAEFPTLFTGPGGKVCLSFWTSTMNTDYAYPLSVTCSGDGGKTFGAISVVHDPALTAPDGHQYPRHQRAAISDDGRMAIVWDEPAGGVYVSTSANGAAWSAPTQLNHLDLAGPGAPDAGHHPTVRWEGGVLWVAYQSESLGGDDAIVVDKSCDGGTTWSGNQVVNANADGTVTDRNYPTLLLTDKTAAIASFVNTEDSDLEIMTLE
ncbi:MAG: sialidase family protein [Polyangiaceae bacterium]